MNLSERLEAARADQSGSTPGPVLRAVPRPAPSIPRGSGQARRPAWRESRGHGPRPRWMDRAATAMFDRLGPRLNDPSLTEKDLHALVRAELSEVVEEEQVPLTTEQQQRLIRDVADDVLGHGPLQRLLDDDTVTEIMVNGPATVYVEQAGKLTLSDVQFTS